MKKKSRSGPTLTEKRREGLGQLRINLRLDPEPAEALRMVALPDEGPKATISRVLLDARKRLKNKAV